MKIIGRVMALCLMVGVLLGVTTVAANATDGNITGVASCPTGQVWSVELTWNSTNVPSNVYAEIKAISTTAGTLSKEPGQGVMSGNQVILAAFPSHVNNWPGVKTHKGNWSDKFSVVNIPKSVNSITVMVQYDYSNGHSDDPTKTIYRPNNCTPPVDACPQLDGDQPTGFQCGPHLKNRPRDIEGQPDCVTHMVTVFHQSQQVIEEFVNGAWVYPDWPVAWTTDSTSQRPTTAQECPPTPVYDHGVEYKYRTLKSGGTCAHPQFVLTNQRASRTWTSIDGVKTYAAWSEWKTVNKVYPRSDLHPARCWKKAQPHLRIIDLCSCKHDKVYVTGRHIAFKSIRQNKNVFTISLVADAGYTFPKDYRHPNGKRATHVKWVVKTTNTKCACPPKKHCAPKPPPPPKPACPCKP